MKPRKDAIDSPYPRRSLELLLPLWLTLGAMVSDYSWAQTSAPRVSYMRSRRFNLPINLPAEKAGQVREIRLYVSQDGESWDDKPAIARPTDKMFAFEAETDGQYWFTLATVDQSGKQKPADVRAVPPSLSVIVDTERPTIDLRTTPPTDGKVGIAWRLRDQKPDLNSFKVEIKGHKDTEWREIKARQSVEGQLEWPALPDDGFLVRATVKDRAGNLGTEQLEIAPPAGKSDDVAEAASSRESMTNGNTSADLARAEPRRPESSRLDANRFEAMRPEFSHSNGSYTDRRDGSGDNAMNNPIAGNYNAPPPPPALSRLPQTFPAMTDHVARKTTTPSTRLTDEERYSGELVSNPPARIANRNSGVRDLRPSFEKMVPAIPAEPQAPPPPAQEEEVRPAVVTDLDRNQFLTLAQHTPPIASSRTQIRRVSAEKKSESPISAPAPTLAPKKIPLVNSTRFSLQYAIKGMGPAGVGRVEIYCTKDGGGTWELLGEDPDLTSPADVRLPGEGRFGLKVVVYNRAGTGKKPQKGEVPQLQVEVDTTPPEAELFELVPDPKNADSLVISWASRDAHLPSDGVSLYFSHDPGNAGWYQIKEGLPPTGQYSWRLPKDIPYQVYLRLMARDMGDNVSVATTQEPIVVDLSAPEATAVGVIATLPEAEPNR